MESDRRTPASTKTAGVSASTGRRVFVAEPDQVLRSRLCNDLRTLGNTVYSCASARALMQAVPKIAPDTIVAELQLSDGPSLNAIEVIKQSHPAINIVILTGHGSVSTAIHCTRIGVDGYLSKPASATLILEAACGRHEPQDDFPALPMTLDRAMWEFINRAVQDSGSISRAADNLGLDKRSLRRKLHKHTPSRISLETPA